MTGRIFIESKPVIFGWEHLYLVYQNELGNEFIIRGGPLTDNPLNYGSIVVEVGVPIAQSEDARIDDDGNPITPAQRNSRQLDLESRNAEDVWDIMLQQAQYIHNAEIPYTTGYESSNSNSVISSILQSIGLIPFFNLPIGKGNIDFPGISNFLNIESTLIGTDANDIINGGTSNDTISGGEGNDTLEGGNGDDTINGGDGQDTIHYSYLTEQGVNITLNAKGDGTAVVGNDDTDQLLNMEHIIGTSQSDIFTMLGEDISPVPSSDGAFFLEGGAGADQYHFNGGYINRPVNVDDSGHNDEIYINGVRIAGMVSHSSDRPGYPMHPRLDGYDILGGGDVDFIQISKNGLFVTILNWENGDYGIYFPGVPVSVQGSETDDVLIGDAGANIFYGGEGNDTLTGGGGADIYYIIHKTNAMDVITDFDLEIGMIDLTDDSWYGATNFSALTISDDNGDAVINLDNNQSLKLQGVNYKSLSASNFFSVATINLTPIAVSDTYTLDEGATLTVAAIDGVLANDTDGDEDALSSILVDDVTHGTLTLNADGSFSYTHDGSENFTDSFTYKVHDGTADGNTVTVSFTINPLASVINGTNGADSLIGTSDVDTIYGFAGNDTLYGSNGNDSIAGGDGDDQLYGQAGNDFVSGGASNDTLFAYNGNDTLEGGTGNDVFAFSAKGGTTDIITDFVIGEDVIDLTHHTLGALKSMSDLMLSDDNGTAVIHLGSNQTIRLTGVNAAQLTINNFAGLGVPGINTTGTTGNDTLYGGAGNDTIYGHFGSDYVYGGDNHDILYGQDGNDVLIGEAGNDLIFGNNGNDLLQGSLGNDSLHGGAGSDIFVFNNGIATGHDVIADYVDGEDIIRLADMPNASSLAEVMTFASQIGNDVVFSFGINSTVTVRNTTLTQFSAADFDFGHDSITGTTGNDSLNSGYGNDTISALAGNDTVYAGTGHDTVYGQAGQDIVYGENGNDYLQGNGDNDTLYGGAGNDIIVGGDDADYLYGEAGADIFLFSALSHSTSTARDTIHDFAQGEDRIMLANIGFTGISSAPANDDIISFQHVEGNTIISDDGTFRILLSGEFTLTEQDFIFA